MTRDAVAEYAAARFGVRRSRWVWGRWPRRRGSTPQRPARRAYQQDPADLARWRQVRAYLRVVQQRPHLAEQFFEAEPDQNEEHERRPADDPDLGLLAQPAPGAEYLVLERVRPAGRGTGTRRCSEFGPGLRRARGRHLRRQPRHASGAHRALPCRSCLQ
ncbi:MAG: winged helix-turn-helix domain-containing protein, partial [Gemmataceae bacterium]|nr:winged helix-turn-helix domain-containing protein [Gemmataceae bacterium]